MDRVFVVMEHDYDSSWIEEVFATRELAEHYLIEKQRAEWQASVDRVGNPIPGTQKWEWWVNIPSGSSGRRIVSEKTYEHPGPFEPRTDDFDWQITEHKVVAA